jgi:hypothetical protein
MKQARRLAAIVVILVVGLGEVGCSRARHVSPWIFVRKARIQVTTVHDVNFVGVYRGRAYLSEWIYWPVIGARTRLLWTEADRLSPALLRELAAEKAREELEAKRSREAQAAQASASTSRLAPPSNP